MSAMNARERQIMQGYNIVAAICVLMVLGRLLGFLSGALGGNFNVLALGMLGLTAWVAWSLYSGQLWARNVVGLLALLAIAQALFMTLGGALMGEPVLLVINLLGLLFNVGFIYLLFFYDPVLEYFRYVGTE